MLVGRGENVLFKHQVSSTQCKYRGKQCKYRGADLHTHTVMLSTTEAETESVMLSPVQVRVAAL